MAPPTDSANMIYCPRCGMNSFRVKVVARGFQFRCTDRNCSYTSKWIQALPRGEWS